MVGGLSDEALAALRAHSKTPTTEVNESIGDLACPVCARVLERKLVEFALVELDVCDAHGCWFDRGEVECISAAIVATPESEPQAPPREMVTVDGEGGSPYIQGFRGLLREMHRIQLDSTRRAARILAQRKRRRFNRS